MRAALRFVSFIASACTIAAASAVQAQSAPPGWQTMPRSGPEDERWFIDGMSPPRAMLTVRESGRIAVDGSALGEWLTRRVQDARPPGGGRWTEPASPTTGHGGRSATVVRAFTWSAGNGFVQYGAASADGRTARIITWVVGARATVDGPRGVMARALFTDLMQAELASGGNASPVSGAAVRASQAAVVPPRPAPAGVPSSAATPVATEPITPAAWREQRDPLVPGARLFVEVGDASAAVWQIRESPRTSIDAPSLSVWLVRSARADAPPTGMQWYDSGVMLDAATAELAMFSRMVVGGDGEKGLVAYTAVSGDGVQGRIIRVVHPTRASLEGRRGIRAAELQRALQLAERAAGRAERRTAAPPVR